MTTQSSDKFWDASVAGFDAIYSGEGRTVVGRRLDRWLRHDIYVRLAETTRLVNELGQGLTVLDLGTGTGRLCVPLARAGHRIVGVDFSKEMLEKADEVTRKAGVREQCTFIQGDVLSDLAGRLDSYGAFDAVAILGVFDYISDPLPALQSVLRFSPKRIIASFPRAGTFRSMVRRWRYRIQRLDCPLFFYSEAQIETFGQTLGAVRTSNANIGQLHLVCFECS
jgi:SAM-dependent methyltransferase